MRPSSVAAFVVFIGVLGLGAPTGASADETDNFTCRGRLSRDSLAVLDSWVNARIQEAIERANRRGPGRCDEACLARELERAVGGSVPHPFTFVPHSRFERWIDRQPQIERCSLPFRETVYGARPYNQPWLFPFLGRIILIASILARELSPAGSGFRWTEYGIKGLSLTGVLSYADVAAAYSGFGFWEELRSIGREGSYVARHTATGRFVKARRFTFATYVSDAWDEAINYSRFHPTLGGEVGAALRARGLTMPVRDCRPLSSLPDAGLYVNPACLAPQAGAARPPGS
jgi:hypothetical protein